MMARQIGWLRGQLAVMVLFGSVASVSQAAILDPGTGGPSSPAFGGALDPNLRAWYRADSGLTLDGGGNVTRWDDLSDGLGPATARDMIPTVGVNSPPFRVASEPTLGNQPVLRFNGVDDVLNRAAGNSPVTGDTERTVIAVITNGVRRTGGFGGANDIEHVLHFGNGANDTAYGIVFAQGGGVGGRRLGNHYWNGFDNSTTRAGISPRAITFRWDNNAGTLRGGVAAGLDEYWINGYNAGRVDTGAGNANGAGNNTLPNAPAGHLKTAANQFVIGGRVNLQGSGVAEESFQGDIAEVIIYDQALSQAELDSVHNYLSTRYGMPVRGSGAIPGTFAFSWDPIGGASIGDTTPQDFAYSGVTARPTDDAGVPVVRLTDNTVSQTGAAFLKKPVTFASDYSFLSQFEVKMHGSGGIADPDGLGADGVFFVISEDVRGPYASADGGGSNGLIGGVVAATQPTTLNPALIVGLDTWHQGVFDPPQNTNTNGSHVEINVLQFGHARFPSGLVSPSLAQTAPGAVGVLNDGVPRSVCVNYDGVTKQMLVYMKTKPTPADFDVDCFGADGPAVLSHKVDLDHLFTGHDLHMGFTAGTGSATNFHDVRGWAFDSSPSGSLPPLPPAGASELFVDSGSVAANPGLFRYNVNASHTGSRIRLTPETANLRGSAILRQPVNYSGGNIAFTTKFAFEITLPGPAATQDIDGNGGDGFAFIISGNELMADGAIGGAGGDMGFNGAATPMVVIEFDTWNSGPFDLDTAHPFGTHIGINTTKNGIVARVAVPRFNGPCGATNCDDPVPGAGPLNDPADGGPRFVWVDLFENELEVFFSAVDSKPATPTMTAIVDFNDIFGSLGTEHLWFGFTAGTGGALQRHEIIDWKMHVAVPEPSTCVLSLFGAAALGLVARSRRSAR